MHDLTGEDQSEGGSTLGFWLHGGKSLLNIIRSTGVDWTASRLMAVQLFAMMPRNVLIILIAGSWDFPGGPVVKTSLSNAGVAGSIPGQGPKIPHALGLKKTRNIKQKQYCNRFSKDFKNSLH